MAYRIEDGLWNQKKKFNNMFKKMFGCLGGWLAVACPHKIIYAAKFLLRGESLRDYIDILRSLKHKPNIFINVAHIVAQHANIHHGVFSSQSKVELLLQPRKILFLLYKTT